MATGTVRSTVSDHGLGQTAGNNASAVVRLGICSGVDPAAAANYALYAFSEISDLVDALGYGPLVEAAADQIAVYGGPVYCVPLHHSVVGSVSAITPARVASSTGTISTASVPKDGYELVGLVVSTGSGQLKSDGNIAMQWSYDGGITYGSLLSVPTTGVITLPKTGGFAVTLSSGTFDEGDTFSATCKAPMYASQDVIDAFTFLFTDPQTWALAHLVGYLTASATPSVNLTASAILEGTLITEITAAKASQRPARAIFEVAESSGKSTGVTEIKAAFGTATQDNRIYRVGTTGRITSQITGAKRKGSLATALTTRLVQIAPSQSPGYVDDGELKNVYSVDIDENNYPGLVAAGFAMVGTYVGKNGFYSDLGTTAAASDSDYTTIMNCRVMDQIDVYARSAAFHYLNARIPTNSDGTIQEKTAIKIENYIKRQISANVGTEYTRLTVTVNRSDIILTTKKLRIKVRAVPYGYANEIDLDIGYEEDLTILPLAA